jgi:hypothetical protein
MRCEGFFGRMLRTDFSPGNMTTPFFVGKPSMNLLSVLSLVLFAAACSAADLMVGVGYGGRRVISTDGKKWDISAEWIEKGADDSYNLMGITWGQGKFVAVGGGGWTKDTQAGHILTSTDGREWKEVHKEPFRVNPVVFGDGLFIAGGPERTLLLSRDGDLWEKGAQAAADGFPGWALWFRHGAFGNGVFVFMGECGAKKEYYWCMSSRSGRTVAFRRDLPQLTGLAFGAGNFIAVGKGVMVRSKDGLEWTKVDAMPAAPDPSKSPSPWIAWTGQGFICGEGKTTLTSADGNQWKTANYSIPCRISYADAKAGCYLGSSWGGNLWSSHDGRTWEKTALGGNAINMIAVKPGS